MAVTADDISTRLSTTSGAAGDSTASTPAECLGKYMSTTALVNGALNNLFADITDSEAELGVTKYKCYFKTNENASDTWTGVSVWILSQIAGGGDVADRRAGRRSER